MPGRRREDDLNLVVIANGLTRRYGKGRDSDATDTLIAGALNMNKKRGGWRAGPDEAMAGQLIVHALSAEGHDASEDGTGQGAPLVVDTTQITSRVAYGSLVRRLTPLECERLQGFPDGWTCLCLPLSAYRDDPDAAALRCRCPDSPRYRALGNAVTVSVVCWIGQRLRAQWP